MVLVLLLFNTINSSSGKACRARQDKAKQGKAGQGRAGKGKQGEANPKRNSDKPILR